jgi:hypothetical protein
LTTHRDQLELLTNTLLEKETLDAAMIKTLLGLDDTANLNIDGVGLTRNIGPEIPAPATV